MYPHRWSPRNPGASGRTCRRSFSLPPADVPEESPPARAATDEPDRPSMNRVGCLVIAVLAIVSGFVEDRLPLSGRQKIVGISILAVAMLLVSFWESLNDSDLAYSDRHSHGRLARLRDRLREFFNIPVI